MRLLKFAFASLIAMTFHVSSALAAKTCPGSAEWMLWNAFKTHFIQDDGRVIDASTQWQHSSSEGQSYGMVFALIAGDRATFDRLWGWTINNLSGGNTTTTLPAWIWGKATDGQWKVLDQNSASDADLWFAYALLEAGRIWDNPDYTRQAHSLLDLIEAQEVMSLPGLGLMLLPGKDWFYNKEQDTWRLNPSYMPIPLLRRLAKARPNGPWSEIAANTATLLKKTAPYGFSPDWTMYEAKTEPYAFKVDPDKGPTGSYDAIRTYLWAGMTSPEDALYNQILDALSGMVKATQDDPEHFPPEKVNTQTGQVSQQAGPFGFSAALLPYFSAKNETQLLEIQKERVQQAILETSLKTFTSGGQPPYYDYVLTLFGTGWLGKQFRFNPDGTLKLKWGIAC